MKQSQSAFSLVLALGLVLLLSFSGLYVVEYSIPYARNIQGIENASQTFYETLSGVEDSLFKISRSELGEEFEKTLSSQSDYSYTMSANGLRIPIPGNGQSPFDQNKNIFSQEQGISLHIGLGRLAGVNSDLEVFFSVPDFDRGKIPNTDILDETNDEELILWQISAQEDTLSTETGTLLKISDVNTGNKLDLWSQFGLTLEGNSTSVSSFYASNCLGINECILNISLISPLVSAGSEREFPFLEYYIESSQSLPSRFVSVSVEGQSGEFYRSLDFSVPRQSSNSAFDFTIFQ